MNNTTLTVAVTYAVLTLLTILVLTTMTDKLRMFISTNLHPPDEALAVETFLRFAPWIRLFAIVGAIHVGHDILNVLVNSKPDADFENYDINSERVLTMFSILLSIVISVGCLSGMPHIPDSTMLDVKKKVKISYTSFQICYVGFYLIAITAAVIRIVFR